MIIDRGAAAPFALAPEEFPGVAIDPKSRWMIAIAGGAHNEIRVAVAPLLALDRSGAGKTPWQTVAGYEDSVELASPHGDRLYLQTFKDASNRKLISVPLNLPDLRTARVEMPRAARRRSSASPSPATRSTSNRWSTAWRGCTACRGAARWRRWRCRTRDGSTSW